jgi:hypothetical protein
VDNFGLVADPTGLGAVVLELARALWPGGDHVDVDGRLSMIGQAGSVFFHGDDFLLHEDPSLASMMVALARDLGIDGGAGFSLSYRVETDGLDLLVALARQRPVAVTKYNGLVAGGGEIVEWRRADPFMLIGDLEGHPG